MKPRAAAVPGVSIPRMEGLLTPFLAVGFNQPADLFHSLAAYLGLLSKWNARMNLTAIRSPEEIILRHFGESLFFGRLVPATIRTVLDLGSGAGFPGIPLQLLRPDLQLTLAESQQKKAAFLREAVRTLNLTARVHAERAETLIPGPGFDLVVLRAVDNMESALRCARQLAPEILILGTETDAERSREIIARVPLSEKRVVLREVVPRGTLRHQD